MKPDLHMPEGNMQPLTVKKLPEIPVFLKFLKMLV
jgi:hypothetical protein